MLLYGDRALSKYQEGGDGKPPYHLASKDKVRCVNCGSACHGHGWRIRYVCLSGNRTVRVWVHRLRCPGCGKTYTVIPRWAHARKVHSLSVILSVVNAYLREGHLVHRVCGWVALKLRRSWVRDFMKRHRKETGDLSLPPKAVPLPYAASGESLKVIGERGEYLSLVHAAGSPHHGSPLFFLKVPI